MHTDFSWPTVTDGEHMFTWDDADDADDEFEGMHGDEMGDADSDVDEEEADRQAEEAAFVLAFLAFRSPPNS